MHVEQALVGKPLCKILCGGFEGKGLPFCDFRGIGGPSTWNLERFDALAHEVRAHVARFTSAPAGGSPPLRSRPVRPPTTADQATSATEKDADAAVAAQRTAAERQAALRQQTEQQQWRRQRDGGSTGEEPPGGQEQRPGFPFTLVRALNTVLYQRQGYQRMARHGTPQ